MRALTAAQMEVALVALNHGLETGLFDDDDKAIAKRAADKLNESAAHRREAQERRDAQERARRNADEAVQGTK